MQNAPGPPQPPAPGTSPGGPPGAGAVPPPPSTPPPPSAVASPIPPPIFRTQASSLPHGIQQLDGAYRNMLKAQGTLEFIEDADARATLVQLTNDTSALIHRMTRKLAGRSPDSQQPIASEEPEVEE